MKIVTDSGADIIFSPEIMKALDVKVVPLKVTLDEETYREGIDISKEDFYAKLAATDSLPITSTPSPGDFAEVYREIAKTDKDILSIHISSGLSGTYNSAVQGAKMVPEANITVYDALTLSAAAGWLSYAASQSIKAGWDKEKIIDLLNKIKEQGQSIYTLSDLTYLIHGGRISHMKGLIASLLNLKPMIGVAKDIGNYEQLGQQRTFKRALDGLVKVMKGHHEPGAKLTVQVLHSQNPEGGEMLKEKVGEAFDCDWLPLAKMSLVLGAHTGPSMVGVAYLPQELWDQIP